MAKIMMDMTKAERLVLLMNKTRVLEERIKEQEFLFKERTKELQDMERDIMNAKEDLKDLRAALRARTPAAEDEVLQNKGKAVAAATPMYFLQLLQDVENQEEAQKKK